MLKKGLFDRLCKKFLPKYIRFWPLYYWLAMWSAPIRYRALMNLPARNDTAWQALRITIRKGPAHSEVVKVLKKGTI